MISLLHQRVPGFRENRVWSWWNLPRWLSSLSTTIIITSINHCCLYSSTKNGNRNLGHLYPHHPSPPFFFPLQGAVGNFCSPAEEGPSRASRQGFLWHCQGGTHMRKRCAEENKPLFADETQWYLKPWDVFGGLFSNNCETWMSMRCCKMVMFMRDDTSQTSKITKYYIVFPNPENPRRNPSNLNVESQIPHKPSPFCYCVLSRNPNIPTS